MSGLHLLVVDDEPTACALMQRVLAKAGRAIDIATSGDEALRMAQHGRYDIALIDLSMPGIDGMATYRRLRDLCPAIRIVMVSGHFAVSQVTGDADDGRLAKLGKPFDVGAVRDYFDRLEKA